MSSTSRVIGLKVNMKSFCRSVHRCAGGAVAGGVVDASAGGEAVADGRRHRLGRRRHARHPGGRGLRHRLLHQAHPHRRQEHHILHSGENSLKIAHPAIIWTVQLLDLILINSGDTWQWISCCVFATIHADTVSALIRIIRKYSKKPSTRMSTNNCK